MADQPVTLRERMNGNYWVIEVVGKILIAILVALGLGIFTSVQGLREDVKAMPIQFQLEIARTEAAIRRDMPPLEWRQKIDANTEFRLGHQAAQ